MKIFSYLGNGRKFRPYEIMKLIFECFQASAGCFSFSYFPSSSALVSIDQKDPEMKSQQGCLMEEPGWFFVAFLVREDGEGVVADESWTHKVSTCLMGWWRLKRVQRAECCCCCCCWLILWRSQSVSVSSSQSAPGTAGSKLFPQAYSCVCVCEKQRLQCWAVEPGVGAVMSHVKIWSFWMGGWGLKSGLIELLDADFLPLHTTESLYCPEHAHVGACCLIFKLKCCL